MITFAPNPIPVVVEGLGSAWVIYIKSNGMFEDDEACISLMDGGQWRHVTTSQIKSWHNATYSIQKSNANEDTTNPLPGINSMAPNREDFNTER